MSIRMFQSHLLKTCTKAPHCGPEERVCTLCQTPKPLAEFIANSQKGYKCRSCASDQSKVWYDKPGNRERHKYAIAHRMYGISREAYEAMAAEQDGKCAICKQPPKGTGDPRTKFLHVDHDHKTGKARALLCYSCNLGLGCFRDDPERIQQAIDYLASYAELVRSAH